MSLIITLSIIGLLLSIYASYTEMKLSKNKKHKALCDIHDKISCTKAFSSEYGKMFGVSNSLAGIGFYILLIILAFLNYQMIIFYLAIASMLATIYLAYVSFFKLKNLCIVCTLIYIVNIILLVASYLAIK